MVDMLSRVLFEQVQPRAKLLRKHCRDLSLLKGIERLILMLKVGTSKCQLFLFLHQKS